MQIDSGQVKHTITFRQVIYAQLVLQIYGASDKPSIKTPLEPGMQLSKADSPTGVNPVLHRRCRHLNFLVTMTSCDLAFAFAELSKFVQAPREVHFKAAEPVLQYMKGGRLADKPPDRPTVCRKRL